MVDAVDSASWIAAYNRGRVWHGQGGCGTAKVGQRRPIWFMCQFGLSFLF